jgi:hypothetical protein
MVGKADFYTAPSFMLGELDYEVWSRKKHHRLMKSSVNWSCSLQHKVDDV